MKTRILVFLPYDMGTISSVSGNLLLSLKAKKELDVKVISLLHNPMSNFSNEQYDYLETTGKKYFLPFQFFKRIYWLSKIKKEFKPHITINTLFICSILSILSGGEDKKIGIFHSPHSQSIVRGKHALIISYFAYKFLYNKLTKLYCVSSEIRDDILLKFKNIDPRKVEVVYNIHNVDNIKLLAKTELNTHEEKIFRDNKVILYCGRFDNNKAPERLLKAFIEAKPFLEPNVCLVFIGNDFENIWPKLEKIILENNVDNQVLYLGLVSNPYPYISKSEVLVSSSYSEGLPGVIIESLLLKTPVIATNSSKGIWEIMSADNQYDVSLSANFRTDYGIITPNLSHKNSAYYNSDISFLSKALVQVITDKFVVNKFNFETQISADKIVSKMII